MVDWRPFISSRWGIFTKKLYKRGFLYEEMDFTTTNFCTVTFIFWSFICAANCKAVEKNHLLLDHRLIFIVFVQLLTKIVWAPNCITYWVAFLNLKPYSHPDTKIPAVSIAVALSLSLSLSLSLAFSVSFSLSVCHLLYFWFFSFWHIYSLNSVLN